jgi:hypothetical protein
MTPRAVDWSPALFSGGHGSAWVFAAHEAGGFALGAVVVLKARRVRRRLRPGRG